MTKPIYLTDPAVAAAYHVAQGEWASVADDEEADWLVANHHGYSLDTQQALPAAGFVHPDAPLPFVAYTPPVVEPTRKSAPNERRSARSGRQARVDGDPEASAS